MMQWLLPARRRLFLLLIFLAAMLTLFPLHLAFNMLTLYFFGPKVRLCTSLDDLFTKFTVVPALTFSTFG